LNTEGISTNIIGGAIDATLIRTNACGSANGNAASTKSHGKGWATVILQGAKVELRTGYRGSPSYGTICD